MRQDRLVAALPDLVAGSWDLGPVEVSPQGGGMNSVTARVGTGGGAYVAKWVPAAARADLLGGARTAHRLADAGLRVGAPLATRTGTFDVPLDDGVVVLLAHVAGEPLTGDTADEQAMMGDLLGRVHRSGSEPALRRETFFGWMRPGLADAVRHPRLAGEDWLAPEVAAALSAYDGLPAVTWGTLHTDPAPEAFLLDPAGGVGLVDWAGSLDGPLLYDVASAVMYLGGPSSARPFLDAYAAAGPLTDDEIEAHLDVFRAFRWAVQAVYFAGRVAARDLTGLDDDSGNRTGLADARRGLAGTLAR